ncbi:MAG: HDOD domain-containing protein [Candidatus Dadabacteria bacterium]|nr:MAG: HDOD domain-containing protein [Candidatus Dadabacteria bacterium]
MEHITNMLPKILLPPRKDVITRARKLLMEPTYRLDQTINCIGEDPVIFIELMNTANELEIATPISPITNIRNCLQRLGNELVIEVLDRLAERSECEDLEVSGWVETYRDHSRKVSIIATILAQVVQLRAVAECRASGLLTYVGDMLSVVYLKDKYIELAKKKSRKLLNFTLLSKYNINVEQITLQYLRHKGFPEILLYPLDRDATPSGDVISTMRPIVMGAQELFEAHVHGRLEKYNPSDSDSLPPQSALRFLQLTVPQIARIHSQVSELLAPGSTAE